MTEVVPFRTHPVDHELADTLREMEELYLKYITFTDRRHAFVCALWAAQTFFFARESCHGVKRVGYLAFVSPSEGCGKTTALEVLGQTCYGQPYPQVNATSASVFAQIDPRPLKGHEEKAPGRKTLILDELDGIAEETDLVNLLNAGYMKGATVHRRGGKNYNELIEYDIFSPKAFGYIRDSYAIRKIKSTLESRCIRILLRKQTLEEMKHVDRYWDLEDAATPIVEKLFHWDMKRVPSSLIPLFKSRVLEPPTFGPRERDIWDNLFAVAYLAGRLDEAHVVAADLTEANRAEISDHTNPDTPVLRDLREDLGRMCDEWGFSTVLAIEVLRLREDRDYNKVRKGHTAPWLTKEKLSSILKKYGVRARPVGEKRVRRIDPDDLKDVLDRHIPDEEDGEE